MTARMSYRAGRHRWVAPRVCIAALFAILGLASPVRAEEPPTAAVPAEAPALQAERVTLPHVEIKSADGLTLIAHLFRPKDGGDAPRPAIVTMHGCSGLLNPTGRFFPLHRAWARTLVESGYVVLVVDSATSRGFGQTCSVGEGRRTMLRDRPKDAYAALQYLQAQPFVRPDRIALMGWSQGGGTVLLTINELSIGRPDRLAQDFAAAIAFYPGSCAERWQTKPFTRVEPHSWTSRIPLLVLSGEADTWTPWPPCAAFLEDAKSRGNPIETVAYANAAHAFDAPNLKRTELPQYRSANGSIPVIGTDPEARADAFARALAFLARRLRD